MPTTISKEKKKLDKIFSEFIRLRDSDENGYGTCCTCGVPKFWREADNGHAVTRGDLATRFHEHNCMLQCKRCNMRGGEQFLFSKEVDRRWGDGSWDEVMSMRKNQTKYSISDYKDLQLKYSTQVKAWKAERGL